MVGTTIPATTTATTKVMTTITIPVTTTDKMIWFVRAQTCSNHMSTSPTGRQKRDI